MKATGSKAQKTLRRAFPFETCRRPEKLSDENDGRGVTFFIELHRSAAKSTLAAPACAPEL